MVALPEDEPDWNCDVDTAVLPEVQVLLPIVDDVPHAPPAQTRPRVGVDLGGVLVAKVPSRMLRNIRAPADVAPMLAAGARECFELCVANCRPENVFIISYVGSQRLRGAFSSYLFAGDGLMRATGVPVRHLVSKDSAVL